MMNNNTPEDENLNPNNQIQSEHTEPNTDNHESDIQPFGKHLEEIPNVEAETTQKEIGPLPQMYKKWFLEYASYVILERAVPHISDGLKPVQRRVLYAMKRMGGQSMTKVAKIVGATMAYHPHGDASINEALVQLGQKGFLIDTQGNWGNILTGDSAAAGRYIEARLSNFAYEILFSDNVTKWKKTYDGGEDEPVSLPVKFPLLLAQGAQGIAVGLNSRILPHNPNELIDAAIAYLKGHPFTIYPDFPTAGLLDVTNYNDGQRGSRLKCRAKITKLDNKTLTISEIPFGTTIPSVIDSIIKAGERGKIRIKRIDDLTAAEANIQITLQQGISSDKTIDALYAFTDCEINISPAACVILNDKPLFCGVSDILTHNVDQTRNILLAELEFKLNELKDKHFYASLEKIFIQERIYKDPEFENAKSQEEVIQHIKTRIIPFLPEHLRNSLSDEVIIRLLEIKMRSILRFNANQHEGYIIELEKSINETEKNIASITSYTINYFKHIKETYGANWDRKTTLTKFNQIETTKVAVLDKKLYINRSEGFIGTELKDDEFVCNCSDIDDAIIFFKSGKYIVTKITEKQFIGKEEVIHIDRYEKDNLRKIYNVIYRDGKTAPYYIKRFHISSIAKDRENDLTMSKPGSRVMYFSANPNGEAEVVKVVLKPRAHQRILVFDKDFKTIQIKGRNAKGNLLTKAEVHRITLKQRGNSTLEGRKIWYDPDVRRLNDNEEGNLLGTFEAEDQIFVMLDNGECYTTTPDLNTHFEENIKFVEKFDAAKTWTAVFVEKESQATYIKRFVIESGKRNTILPEGMDSKLVFLTDSYIPILEINFDETKGKRAPLLIRADEFIAVKGIKAKGKRATVYPISQIQETDESIKLSPMQEQRFRDEENQGEGSTDELDSESEQDAKEIRDELLGVRRLNFEE